MYQLIGNGFAKKVADMIADPLNGNKAMPSIGTVINYYHDNNTADISVSVDRADTTKQGVSVLLNTQGKSFLKSGDPVLVIFLYGDPDLPVILGKLDEKYYTKTREEIKRNIITL